VRCGECEPISVIKALYEIYTSVIVAQPELNPVTDRSRIFQFQPLPSPQRIFTTKAMATNPEENRRLVLEFMELVFNHQDFSKADRFLATDLIEHNPNEKDGLAYFKESIPKLLAGTPKGSLVVVRSARRATWSGSTAGCDSREGVRDRGHFPRRGRQDRRALDVLQEMQEKTVSEHPYF